MYLWSYHRAKLTRRKDNALLPLTTMATERSRDCFEQDYTRNTSLHRSCLGIPQRSSVRTARACSRISWYVLRRWNLEAWWTNAWTVKVVFAISNHRSGTQLNMVTAPPLVRIMHFTFSSYNSRPEVDLRDNPSCFLHEIVSVSIYYGIGPSWTLVAHSSASQYAASGPTTLVSFPSLPRI